MRVPLAMPALLCCCFLLLPAALGVEADVVPVNAPNIDANESAAIAACKTYAEAQDIYRRTDWDSDGLLEYAQAIKGANSLYERTPGTGDLTLVDKAFANAEGLSKALDPKDIPESNAEVAASLAKLIPKLAAEDYAEREAATAAIEKLGPHAIKLLEKEAKEALDVEARSRCNELAIKLKQTLVAKLGLGLAVAAPKAGYCFKVLTGQGPQAPGGRKTYIVAGAGAQAKSMTLGYALLAFPASYGVTGRKTFQINNTGTVYEKDLGAETQKNATECTEYNPDPTWVVSE